MSISVCIPTLNAIEEFWKCVDSILKSSVTCNIFAIDNGGMVNELRERLWVHKPVSNLGVAGSWNWFIDNTPDVRIITNDDIVFDQYAIESMLQTLAKNRREGIVDLVIPDNLANSFSCFLIPQEMIDRVGKFDEWISPKYGYFEDDDYSRRMSMNNMGITRAPNSFVEHVGSATLKHFDKKKEMEHHDRFRLARNHYIKKWGGEPRQEKFVTPFGQ